MRSTSNTIGILLSIFLLGPEASPAQISIPTVPVGHAGNSADFTGFGAVDYTYNIGTTEVTSSQYAAFLNAKAKSDPYDLYSTSMADRITRSGASGSYTYAVVSGRANHPVNNVSYWDATRFVNWLHNGQGSGDTETGAYTLIARSVSSNSVSRNAGWRWALPSENEWYKAAYHQPANRGGDADNYWVYPTSANSINTAQANYGQVVGNTTPVGSYAPNFYGTFDMGGNVSEFNEAIFSEVYRGLRGGAYSSQTARLLAGAQTVILPTDENVISGFRVVQAVPEPATLSVVALGALAVLRKRRKG